MKKMAFLLVLGILPICGHAAEPLVFGKPVDTTAEVSSRVLEIAYRQIGVEIRLVELPAERSLQKANEGSLDGDVNRIAGIEKKYNHLIRVPVPVNTVEHVVVTKNHDFTVAGWESLKPYSIAIRIGTKIVESGTTGMKVSAFPTYQRVFDLVARDRYDILVVGTLTALDFIHRYGLTDLKILTPPLTRLPLYHYLHRKHRNLVDKIGRSLQKMQQKGSIIRERKRVIDALRKGA